MKVWCLLLFFVLALTESWSQESGWADSLGYKQQKLKTGSVQQVRFSLTGDSLFSVTKDSSWNLYIWDTFTGKLLSSRQFNNTNDTKVLSVWLAEDTKTYSITIQKHDTITATIYSTDKQAVINSTTVKLKDVTWSMAYYSLQTGNMWLVCNTYHDANTSWGPTGTNSDFVYHFTLNNRIWTERNKYEGSSFYVTFGKDYTLCSRMAYYRDVVYDRGQIVYHNYWFKSELIGDTILYRRSFDNYPSEGEWSNIEVNLLRNNFITQDGNNFFNINVKSLSHYSQPLWNYTSTVQMEKFPYYIKPLNDNQNILFTQNQFSYIFNIGLNRITDTLTIPFLFSSCSQFHNSDLFVFASMDGYIRLRNITTNASKLTDFRSSRTIMYPHTSIAFFPITKKGAREFHWDFGDGSTSQEQFPAYTYSETGNYTVMLIVKYTNRPEDTIIKKNHILIEPHLMPKFSADKVFGSPPLEVLFTDHSEGNVQKWLWDFGDGTNDTVQKPTHIYTEQGTFYVGLTITDKIRSKTTLTRTLITTTPYFLDTIFVSSRTNDKRVNVSYGSSGYDDYINRYLKGFVVGKKSQLMFYRQECRTNHYKLRHTDIITSYEYITTTSEPYYIPYEQYNSCNIRENSSEYALLGYRSNLAITAFMTWSSTQSYGEAGLYNSDGKNLLREGHFSPDGWSYNFDGVFFPNETDVFLFRKKGDSASLQFFANRDSLVKRIRIQTQFSRIFSSTDSNTLILIKNPSFSITDSTRNFTISYFDLKGNIIKQNKVEKKTDCAISDIFSLGNNEFLLCGYTANKDSLGKLTKQQGYIVKINAEGWILWEHFFPTWKSIRKIEKHPNGYYAGFGLPFEKKKHGFIAFRGDGKLLSDYRLFQAPSSFYAYDFVIGNNENDIWFIGSEDVSGQGERGTIYTCNNPVTPTTDINDNEKFAPNTEKIIVYPNPAQTSVTIKNYSGDVILVNGIGEVVLESSSNTIDISKLNNGIYYITTLCKPHTTSVLSIIR